MIDRWLPEWAPIRLRGSSSPVHSFTVDRHSLETCVFAAEVQRDVARPDLLAVAALLHDIGKGVDGDDHSIDGEPMAVAIATRWGFDADDAATIGRLVRWHLLLPTIATRRDIEDPSTAANVAEVVESADFLELLAALSASDAQATGSAAWTTWRRGLIEGSGRQDRRPSSTTRSRARTRRRTKAGRPTYRSPTTAPPVRLTSPCEVEAHKDGSLLTVVTSEPPRRDGRPRRWRSRWPASRSARPAP